MRLRRVDTLFGFDPKILDLRDTHPLLLRVVVCRKRPSLVHELELVCVIRPDPLLVETVFLVVPLEFFVVVTLVLLLIFLDVRLYAMLI